ncbi:MAG TPA: hypothetical protein VFM21_11770 [Terriglobia bacterium]|nr:hypothetical protein [Terriglobia bacterium]
MAEAKSEPKAKTPTSPSNTPVFSADGVDLTLIRWMLSLSPTERLEVLQEHIWSIMRLRGEDSET